MRESDAAVDWVDVSDEPHHIEQFRNGAVRVYQATLTPGVATQYHRHGRDTIYVVAAGGRLCFDALGRQRTAIKLGRSTPLRRQLRWWLTRALTGGWIRLPAGTLIAQPHGALPLVHRVVAHRTNLAPVRLIGVEQQREKPPAGLTPSGIDIDVEYRGPCGLAYRLHLSPGGHTGPLRLPSGGVLIVISGTATAPTTSDAQFIDASQIHWLADQTRLHNSADEPFHALLIAI